MKNKKKFIALVIVMLLALIAGTAVYAMRNAAHQEDESNVNDSNEGINYGPPSEENLRENNEIKEELGNQKDSEDVGQPDSGANNGNVKPVITYTGQTKDEVEVAARVPGVIENDGTCKLTMKKDSKTATESKKATSNVSETSCGFIAISKDKLSKGTWSAYVSYSSKKSQGVSDTVKIEVQ